MILFLALPIIAYLSVTWWLSRGLLRKDSILALHPFCGTVSVIVAARNEEEHLPLLLTSLEKQSFPRERWDVTVVNDRSSDSTERVLTEWKKRLPNLSIISLTETDTSIAPKKFALQQAISQTAGDILMVTDADCEVTPQWIEEIAQHFADNSVGLVQGITLYQERKRTFLWLFQSIDFFSHSVVAAAGIGRSLPINSNANNFAFRRTVFGSLDGYGETARVISGDDDLFLQRVWEQGKWTIHFAKSVQTVVRTEPAPTWRDLLEQRKRWGSKTMYYKVKQKGVLAIIFFYYILCAGSVLTSLVGLFPMGWLLLLGGVKILGELLFLVPAAKMWKPPFSLIHVLWSSGLQLIVVLYAVVIGSFGTFRWKGETFKRVRSR